MDIQKFLQGYMSGAIFSSTDESDESGGVPLDSAGYTADDFTEDAIADMRADCESFIQGNAEDLEASELDDERAGSLFWFNRNGHGVGFWDEGLGEVGTRLSKASKVYGESYVYIGDDEQLHIG